MRNKTRYILAILLLLGSYFLPTYFWGDPDTTMNRLKGFEFVCFFLGILSYFILSGIFWYWLLINENKKEAK